MRKIVILNKPSNSSYVIPILWMSAKTYYEENSEFVDQWDWSNPTPDYGNIDELIEWIVSENPTALAISNYVWNEEFHTQVAQEVKKRLPSIYILWGGPQQEIKFDENWFKDNDYVDLVIPGDAYGETSFCDILNNISKFGYLNAKEIPYCYYPDLNRNRMFNSLAAKKRDFNWPSNIWEAQKDHIMPLINSMKDENMIIKTLIETSRGCPYKCSFCDWGGGTYTKTVKKPFGTVMKEIESIGKLGIEVIFVADANFGMFSIDIEYARKIVEIKEKYGYPRLVTIQPTKVKLDQLSKIYEILAEADMLNDYQISIQDIDEDVKKNVERVDFSFDDQVAMFRELQKKKNLPIYIEGILGLPGASIRTMNNAIDKIIDHDLPYALSHHWILLPETPAYSKEFREKMKIVTAKNKSSVGVGTSSPIIPRSDMAPDPGVTINTPGQNKTEYVVGTFSYTPDDWIDMNFLQLVVSHSMQTDILKPLVKYLKNNRKIKPSEFFSEIISEMSRTDGNLNDTAHQYKETLREWLTTDDVEQAMLVHDEINFKVSPWLYVLTSFLTNIDEFFNHVTTSIGKLSDLDHEILDLIKFCKNRTLDINYHPGRTFECDHDWTVFVDSGDIVKESSKFIINDTEVITGGTWFDMNWINLSGPEKTKQFIYRFCYDYKSPKVARKLIRLR